MDLTNKNSVIISVNTSKLSELFEKCFYSFIRIIYVQPSS